MRLRVQAAAMRYLRAKDPETNITPWALRSMILMGKIPSVQIGRKKLIDLDTLDQYIFPTHEPEFDAESGYGSIRPVRIVR